MRILIFNWRDIKNPEAGGAEVFTHKIAKRWVEWGNEVTLFTARFSGGKKEETIDGIRIVRDGGKYTVYWKAKRHYKTYFRGKFDVVIDEINTCPFFAPDFVSDTKVVALIHQLAREFWFYEMPFPVNYIGRYLLEPRWLKKYIDIPTVTVSESTKEDLISLGFKNVFVVLNGVGLPSLDTLPQKEEEPTLVFLGRMKKAKLPEHALMAFRIVKERIPQSKLWFVGDGYLKAKLEKEAGDGVQFFGHVSEEKKLELLSQAHVAVVPGVREGWGQVVIEANACGTPVVGYDIPGLRDSIKHGETGLLVPYGDTSGLARAIIEILSKTELHDKMKQNALKWSSNFGWDKSAKEFLELIGGIVDAR